MERFDLILQHSPWFIPLCLLAGLVYAAVLYYKEYYNEFSRRMRYLLASVRFLLVSFLAFLLLAPLLKKESHQREKPVVVFAQDFSASIVMTKDSAYYRTDYLDKLSSVLHGLGDDYRVQELAFGQEISPGLEHEYDMQYTDMGSLLSHIHNSYENRNLGAVFIASDGIINSGADPYYRSRNMTFPLYTIAMGDSTSRTDLRIERLRNNDIAYKGNRFPVEVEVAAENARGKTATLVLEKNGEELERESFSIDNDNQRETFTFTPTAQDTGMQEYNLRLKPLKNEENTANNHRRLFIEVLQTQQQILILGRRPHPDMAAIRRAIENNPNYETEVATLNDFQGKLPDFDLLVLHGLPNTSQKTANMLDQLAGNKVPVWFIAGPGIDINLYNRYGSDLNLKTDRMNQQEVTAVVNDNFTLFRHNKDPEQILPGFPPLISIYGEYTAVDESRVLLYRRIGSVTTSQPLWAFAKDSRHKYAATFGEGLWRWRIYNYRQNMNHRMIDELIRQTVKYLVAGEDKSRFRLKTQARYAGFEPIHFSAELYNESYELTNEPEVNITITSGQGKEYSHVMSRRDESYELKISRLPEGLYNYKGSTTLGNERFEKEGRFVVEEVNLENQNTTADHHMLQRLANENSGRMINDRSLERIPEILEEAGLKPQVYTMKEYMEWIHLRWLLGLLIALLTLEWTLRKINGAL